LDRLLTLLDAGSSSSVRNTAAKQLAQLAVKSVISDVTVVDDDVKTGGSRQLPLNDSIAWSELLSVVARVGSSCFSLDLRLKSHLDHSLPALQVV